jgi:hypothetical protein
VTSTPGDNDPPPQHFLSSLPLIDALATAAEEAVAANELDMAASFALQLSRIVHKFHWMKYAVAFDDLAVEAVEALPESERIHLHEFRLVVFRQNALDHLLLGDLDIASERFIVALSLLDESIEESYRAALQWDASLLEKWRRDFTAALGLAFRALDYYDRCEHPNERQRFHLHIADLLLDILSNASHMSAFEPTSENYEYLDLARAHLIESQPAINTWYAPEIEIAFILTYARFSRLDNRGEDRLSLLEYAMQQASNIKSTVALGQVLTAIGDELLAETDFEAASQRYREAIKVLSSSPAPGLALMPKRNLRWLEEFLNS